MTERRGDDEPTTPDPWASWPQATPSEPNPASTPNSQSAAGTPSTGWRVPGWLARPRLAAVAVGLFAAAVLYRYVALGSFNSWTIFFHGLPMVLALALALVPTGEASPSGRVFIGTTYALLLSATVAGEGSICIFIAAPFIFLMVGFITALLRWIDPPKGKPKTYGIVLPVVLVASLASGASQPPPTTATAVTVVSIDGASVVERLAAPPVVPPVDAGFLSMASPNRSTGAAAVSRSVIVTGSSSAMVGS